MEDLQVVKQDASKAIFDDVKNFSNKMPILWWGSGLGRLPKTRSAWMLRTDLPTWFVKSQSPVKDSKRVLTCGLWL